MADIELVIKLDKDIAQGIIDGKNDTPRTIVRGFQATIADAIKKGTLLPKGHGDLIDRRELKKEVYTTTEWNGDIHRIIYEASIDDAKPIIEADKLSNNELENPFNDSRFGG
ncbi:hypothetical protein SAMN05660484_02167 [Eubacterium ruminantium]|uniref:Uncharacterized protein n=1 Tax=Eubacterium ruminantium TaxID=42322 RepID=A0A1T4QQG1_9FIRM|nr:hypothetical protein [Eubacterium ruminantium]SCW63358.1 hypothetical protein SAMN05660484_02167 [Eubacterium ruminantium]SDN45362.1 hypothetical protein SAMN04490370_12531 [Eubacterium ruminantium]SKA06012.1 hypothetical protein SAMN02745110_02474 [Eubacterium ruminantium]